MAVGKVQEQRNVGSVGAQEQRAALKKKRKDKQAVSSTTHAPLLSQRPTYGGIQVCHGITISACPLLWLAG